MDGNSYGTTVDGGASGQGNIFKITSTGEITSIYDFCSKPKCADGGIEAAFTVESDKYIATTVPPGATTGVGSVLTPSGILNSSPQFVVAK